MTGPGRGATWRTVASNSGANCRVAQRVGADRQTGLVVEQAEHALLPGAQQVRFLSDGALAHDEVGESLRARFAHPGHDVEEPGAALPQHVAAQDRHGSRLGGRIGAQPQPRLGQRMQAPVALGVHSQTGLSPGTRSNHKNP